MKKLLILFLLLTASASSQFAMVASWNSAAVAVGTDTAYTNPDSLKLLFFASDLADSLGKASDDTTYIAPNRAKWFEPFAYADGFQTTSSRKPVYNADSSALLFDGIDDNIVFASASLMPQPTTIVIVCRFPSPNTIQFIYDGTDAANRHALYHTNNNLVKYFAGSEVTWRAGTPDADSLAVFTAQFNGASSFVRMNGTTYATTSPGTNGIIGMIFGAAIGAVVPIRVAVRFIAVYHKALTSLEISNIEHALAIKYPITLP